jgi:hypothetical protein
MNLVGTTSVHVRVRFFVFLLWCKTSTSTSTTATSPNGNGNIESQKRRQQLLSRDISGPELKKLDCRRLEYGHYEYSTRRESLELRGGSCPEEGVESELSTAEANESTDEEDVESASVSVAGEDDDIGLVSSDVAADVGDDLDSSRSKASELRLEGKEAHDKGDFGLAAELFQKAADSLQDEETGALAEEYATCRLHQALCYLKSEEYDECLDACSDILESEATHTSAVTARAYHRRAKAKLALDDQAGALQDARSAAFLGDRKAVALYGRLMRETSSSLSGTNADMAASPASPSAALFESLMSKSSPSDQTGFNPASLLFGGEKTGLLNSLGGSGGSGLAKSVITSLSKRLDDESTQDSISTFLQNTNKFQLQQFASMAGMEVPETVLDRIEGVCHGVTPRTIRRTLKTTKGVVYVVRIGRRISRLLQKYRSLIVFLIMLQWAKSAILRPMPVNRALAKKQAKAALKDAMKANRAAPNSRR